MSDPVPSNGEVAEPVPHEAGMNTPTPQSAGDLRADLVQLVAGWTCAEGDQVRALLAAHPESEHANLRTMLTAAEEANVDIARSRQAEINMWQNAFLALDAARRTDADTRREHVAREMGYRLRTVAAHYRMCGKHGEEPDPAFIAREITAGTDALLGSLPAQPAALLESVTDALVAVLAGSLDVRAVHGADCTTPGGCYYHDAARAALAVLPGPPAVDEVRALIETHVAEFEASIARLTTSIQDPVNTISGRAHDTSKLHGQRGAVYALRRLATALDELPAQPVVDEAQDEDGLTAHERAIARRLWERWENPDSGGIEIHDDPRTVALWLRPTLRGTTHE